MLAAGTASAAERIHPPPLQTFVPRSYHVLRVYRANLSGGPVRDAVVLSTGPASAQYRHDDLQVISWLPRRRSWLVTFDAQRPEPGTYAFGPHESNAGPGLLGPPSRRAAVMDGTSDSEQGIDAVRFAPLLGLRRDQLVFSLTNAAGGGMQGILAIVDVHDGGAKVIYSWYGETGLWPWKIRHNVVSAQANYLGSWDAECCPAREYEFAVAARRGRIVEIADDRPFLGVIVRYTPRGLAVARVVARTPAAGKLQRGDVIMRIDKGPGQDRLETAILDQIARFRAGQAARLLIERRGRRLAVTVTFASMTAAAAETIRVPANIEVAAT